MEAIRVFHTERRDRTM